MGNTRQVPGMPYGNDSMQPIQKCTLCYKQVHHVCLSNDEQAASTPVCRACASNPDPDRTELRPVEPPVPPDGDPRQEEPEGRGRSMS